MGDLSTEEFERLRLLMAGACVRPFVHDTNNSLGAAMAYAELAQMDSDNSVTCSRHLGEVVSAVARCSKLMNQFAQLVRPLRHTQEYKLKDLVQEALDLRQYTFRVLGLSLHGEYATDMRLVFGYPAATQYAVLAVLLDIERMVAGGQRVDVRVVVEPMGDHAAIRLFIQPAKGGPPSAAALAHFDSHACMSDLSIDTARMAIAMQNGQFNQIERQSYLLTVPFAGSADAISAV